MNKRIKILNYIIFTLILIFTGCTVKVSPTSVPESFLSEKSRIGFVWTSSTPTLLSPGRPENVWTEFYAIGGGAIGSAIIRTNNKEMIEKIQAIPAEKILNSFLKEQMASEAEQAGFTAVVGEPIFYTRDWNGWGVDKGWLEKSDYSRGKNNIPSEFDSFAQKHNLQKLIVIDCVNIGITKHYGPLGVTLTKKGFKELTTLRLYLADMKTGGAIIAKKEIAFNDPLTEEVFVPPDFEYVVNNITNNLKSGLEQAFFFVFHKAP